MKNLLLAVRPKWCEKIASGQKTIEVRKSAPKEVPFKAYIYCTKGRDLLREISCWNTKTEIHTTNYKIINLDYCTNKIANGKVIGEFICDEVYSIKNQGSRFSVADEAQSVTNEIARQSCLDYDDMVSYLSNKDGYGWHISDLKIYDEPKELSEFYTIDESGNDCCIACVYHETPIEEMPCRTCTGERRYLYRSPQSWQYVEKL